MTTAYTSLLGLALPVTGELSGTWGDTVNNSITSLLDTSVAGTTNVSTDTDVTLTTTTGAANTARQAILLFSGARTALRTVTAPAQSKVYTVINATTGGFSVKLVGAGPTTGVTIVAGESAVCAWNGSDFIKISNTGGSASFTNVTVTGTTTLSGLTASTALALDASKNVVSVTNTGTGNNVLSASPTLTGTIGAASLTLSTDLTLSGGTANGVAYLNGSKIVTSGSALTFDGTNFTVGASATTGDYKAFIQKAGGELLGLNASSGTLTRIAFGNATASFGSTQIIANASDLAFITNSSEQMRLTSTGLGIGTSSPNGTLQLSRNASSGNWLVLDDTRSGFGDWAFYKVGANDLTIGYDTTAGSAPTQALTISYGGNLGLGVTPSAWQVNNRAIQLLEGYASISSNNSQGCCDVAANCFNGGSAATSGWKYTNTGTAVSLFQQQAGAFKFLTAASGTAGNAITFTQAMTLDASGNLGIGTTSPATRLEVLGANEGEYFRAGGGTISGRSLQFSSFSVSGLTGVGHQINVPNANGVLTFATGGTERARIDSSGNLLIGQTSAGAGARLEITGVSSAGEVASFTGTSALGTLQIFNQPGISNRRWGIPAGADAFIWTGFNSGAYLEQMRLDASGNLLVGTTSPIASSKVAVACASGTQSVAFGIASGVTRSSGTQYGYTIWRDNTTETSAVTFVENAGSGNNAASYVVRTNAGTGGTGVTNVSGGVALVNGATSWSSYSDLRLKHDVVPVTNAIESILKIDPIFFKWNDRPADQQRSIGVSAQSVEKVFPELIDRSGIYDVEGGAMQVRYTELIPVLLASIQEQQAIIESMRTEIDALKAKVGA